jgi:AsmA protein
MKKTAIVLGVLIILLLVVAVSLPFLIDANQFRPRLEAELTRALGREVKLGDLKLDLFSGSVKASDLAIAEDPAYSKDAFLSARQLKVSVEMRPLLFSRKLNVTGIEIDAPQIALMQAAGGDWNFSSLGGKPSAPTPAAPPSASGAVPEFVIKLIQISDGRVSLQMIGDTQPKVLDKVNIEIRDFSPSTASPFTLTASLQGGGDVKLEGSAGPLDKENTAETPFNAKLQVMKLDLVKTGLVRPQTGLGGLVTWNGTVDFKNPALALQGKVEAEQLKLARKGMPAKKTVAFDFVLNHDTRQRAGKLTRGGIHIGNAKAVLTGGYQLEQDAARLQMKLEGNAMAIGELTAMLPSLDIVLPQGSHLEGGTLTLNATAQGPTDKLVVDGSIEVQNTKLMGFDLGSNMRLISSLAGVKIAPDTSFQTLSTQFHDDAAGVRIDNISVVAPEIGTLNGAGIVRANHDLDFKMRASLRASGGLLGVVSGKADTGVPFSIRGTSAAPKFIPDVKGMVGGLAQERLKNMTSEDVNKAATGIMNLFRKKQQ